MPEWKAFFHDHSCLNQFNADGKEVLFGKVMERVDDLKALSIHLSGGQVYEVSLVDGSFNINGIQIFILDPLIYSPNKLENIRPIYFQRRSTTIGVATNKSTGPEAVLFTAIGFQCNLNGRNIKRFLAVFSDGHIEVRERK